jgi:hypothetical protein
VSLIWAAKGSPELRNYSPQPLPKCDANYRIEKKFIRSVNGNTTEAQTLAKVEIQTQAENIE